MSEKKPFHEVVSRHLMTAPIGINSDLASAKAAEVAAYLAVLQESKMPPEAARQIAEDHAHLPKMLRSVGQNHLADFAVETLEDLKSREDEKNPETSPTRSALDDVDPIVQTT